MLPKDEGKDYYCPKGEIEMIKVNETDEMNKIKITYSKKGDYLYPDLILLPQPEVHGKYAFLRKSYLQKHKRIIFSRLLTTCTLNQHLMEIEQEASEKVERLVKQMAMQEGVDEELKAKDMMKWIGLMNNFKQSAEEIVLKELIYV